MPLLQAISLGVASVEADVWLVNGTLYASAFQKNALRMLTLYSDRP